MSTEYEDTAHSENGNDLPNGNVITEDETSSSNNSSCIDTKPAASRPSSDASDAYQRAERTSSFKEFLHSAKRKWDSVPDNWLQRKKEQ